jgi:alpha-galactosidase
MDHGRPHYLGVEWDLAKASAEEISGLRRWIAFYKRERALLLTGDVVRMDAPDSNVRVHGVVGRDRSRAISAAAALESLSPDATYRVEPVFPGTTPSGLVAPVWWGQPTAAGQSVEPTPCGEPPGMT